jgi:hypothetical protein
MGAARDPKEQPFANWARLEPEQKREPARLIEIVRPIKFGRIPTHAVGFAHERRRNPRAALNLPLRLVRIADLPEALPISLVTKNISSSGVYFLAPRRIEPGTAIMLEVALVDRPLGYGSVRMCTAAHVVRAEPADMLGWHGLAASFDDFDFERDEHIPLRFRQ